MIPQKITKRNAVFEDHQLQQTVSLGWKCHAVGTPVFASNWTKYIIYWSCKESHNVVEAEIPNMSANVSKTSHTYQCTRKRLLYPTEQNNTYVFTDPSDLWEMESCREKFFIYSGFHQLKSRLNVRFSRYRTTPITS